MRLPEPDTMAVGDTQDADATQIVGDENDANSRDAATPPVQVMVL